MLDEDQISFRSVSSTFDVEDYSHQIAEIIGLRNESSFIQAGVSEIHHTSSLNYCSPLQLCCESMTVIEQLVDICLFSHLWLE